MIISKREKRINLRRLIVFLLLTITFIILKINHLIKWSWFWVFCPIWIPIVILVGLGVGIIVYEWGNKEESHFN